MESGETKEKKNHSPPVSKALRESRGDLNRWKCAENCSSPKRFSIWHKGAVTIHIKTTSNTRTHRTRRTLNSNHWTAVLIKNV